MHICVCNRFIQKLEKVGKEEKTFIGGVRIVKKIRWQIDMVMAKIKTRKFKGKGACSLADRKNYLSLKRQYNKNPSKKIAGKIQRMKKKCKYPD